MLASICGSCLQHLFLWCLPNGDFVFPSFTNWTYSVHRGIPSPLLICQYLFSYVYIMDFKKEFYDLCLAAVHSVMFDSFMTPMDCSTPGFPVLHSLPEFAQIHVHWVSDAIQSSHPLSSPSPPAFNLSQPASGSFSMSQFFTSGVRSIGASASALVLPVNIQSWLPLGLTGLISLLSKGLPETSLALQFKKSSGGDTVEADAFTCLEKEIRKVQWLIIHE